MGTKQASLNAERYQQTTTTRDFTDKDSRKEDMDDAIETWIDELTENVENARQSQEFTEFLTVMSNFHNYSRNNQALIKLQSSGSTRVAGYNTWKNDFNRTVKKGETAIWIWAPITTEKCPSCGNSESYHNNTDCDEETDPDTWSSGIVSFRPVSVFDVSQTEGEDLPELDTEAYGDTDNLSQALIDAGDKLGIPEVNVIAPDDWPHGRAKGVSKVTSGKIDILDRNNDAAKASTLVHEFTHTLLHSDVSSGSQETQNRRKTKEVEAEATAYVVGRHFGLDMSGSSFYLASWAGEDTEKIKERLDRISKTSKEIINTTEEIMENRD